MEYATWLRRIVARLLLSALVLLLPACLSTRSTLPPAPTVARQASVAAVSSTPIMSPTIIPSATQTSPAQTAVADITPVLSTATAIITATVTPLQNVGTDDLMDFKAPDCATPYTGLLKEIAALNSLTVRFTLCRPEPAFLAKAAFAAFAIQPREYIQETGGTGDLLDKPIGTGPYMLDTWKRGDSITFKRFADYWGKKAIAKTLVFRWNAKADQRVLQLQSGMVDGIDAPDPLDRGMIQRDPRLQLIDAVDVDGDGLAELMFREYGFDQKGYMIYGIGRGTVTKVFEGATSPLSPQEQEQLKPAWTKPGE